jgi:hypothetical protein
MSRSAGIWIAALIVLSLAIGVFWTIRTAPPSPKPWWVGKNIDFKVEIWEPGKDMATVAMTMPKRTVDAMYAFGLKTVVSTDHHKVYLNQIRSQVERLPQGEKLTLHEEGATIKVWLEEKK